MGIEERGDNERGDKESGGRGVEGMDGGDRGREKGRDRRMGKEEEDGIGRE